MKPHKHRDLIRAWADGAEIEFFEHGKWHDKKHDCWYHHYEYRIKPEPKPDWIQYLVETSEGWLTFNHVLKTPWERIVKVVRDGETGELKSAEVLK